MSALIFDTHAFIKSFVNATSEESKAEILAKAIVETRQESDVIIEKKFDKTKNELATKRDIHELDIAMKRNIHELELTTKRDIHELEVRLIKRIIAIMSGQITIFVLILKFFFKGAGGV